MTAPTSSPKSLVMHSAARHYDLLASLLTLGREKALRQRLVELARIAPGERVLDVGCGTGSLAIAAKRAAGTNGSVSAIDPSPEMIAQARAKSEKARLDVDWQIARAEALPFPDASIDGVTSTLMMHHLPRVLREAFVQEIHRVLRPSGRVLIVDFEPPAKGHRSLISHFHRHGHVSARSIQDTVANAGLHVIDTGLVGASDLHFALATVSPSGDSPVPFRSLPPLPRTRWMVATIVVGTLLVLHALLFGGFAAALERALSPG